MSGEAPDDGEQGHDAVKDSDAVAQVEPAAGYISRRQQAHRFRFLTWWHHRLRSPRQVTRRRKGRYAGATWCGTWSGPVSVLGPPRQPGLSSGRWESMRRHSWYILLWLTAPGYSRNLRTHTHTSPTLFTLRQHFFFFFFRKVGASDYSLQSQSKSASTAALITS